ncbi:MAG TPA: SUMF1/EgtB/PvdO family nonheme iron enzyme, partial [Longimicrobium sp.]|nr:SUMF1/EgtB/PvdO family nonheme iron enzyme [Longimicrobium sp.]
LEYLAAVQGQVLDALRSGALSGEREYFVRLAVAHEDMHDEAFTYTRQTLEYPAPPPGAPGGRPDGGGPLEGDARVPGGRFRLGVEQGSLPFLHDNEKWAHEREVKPFRISRAAVTQAELAGFVDAGGYRERRFWSEQGWQWRASVNAEHPVYWRRGPDGWERRDWNLWVPLEPHRAAIHVNWYEADAFCRWAGRRLPTELEWEVAAAGEPDGQGGLSPKKRRYPWGDTPPTPERANLDARALGTLDVGALPEGDSAFGCRQLLGNAWEWTSDDFLPYPGFSADPYRDYSEPWFGTHKVLRGGCWVTRARLIRNSWRNFYTPDRRDVLAGFRTCAL